MSNTLIWSFVTAGLLAVILLGLLRFRDKFRRRDALLTRAEIAFLWALEQVIASNERVMAKVRLLDVLEPAGAARAFVRARARLRQTHVDFVVCHRDTLAIRYAITMDNRTDDSPSGRESHAFLEMAMKSAGVALHHVRARDRYKPEEVRQMLALVQTRATAPRVTRHEPTIRSIP